MSFDDDADPVVDQVCVALQPTISAVGTNMPSLLSTFGVKAADMSPFLREFDSVSDLREVYNTFLPDYASNNDDEDNDLEDESSSPDIDSVEESEEETAAAFERGQISCRS